MNLRRVVLVSAVLTSVFSLITSTARAADPAAPAWCATGDPKSVLACLSAAYTARDIAAYEKLLAPDFKFMFAPSGVPSGPSWGREEDIKGTRLSMFENKEIASIEVTFDGDAQVTAGPKPDTWTLDGITASIHVISAAGIKPAEMNAKSETKLVVQLVRDAQPHYVILEWSDVTPKE